MLKSTMNDNLISDFREFLGIVKFQDFVRQVNGFSRYHKRLRWWQEKAWDAFIAQHPEYGSINYDAVREEFSICEIHLEVLHPDIVEASYGNWRFPQYYLEAKRSSFPHANFMYAGDSGEFDRRAQREVLYCESCRTALQTWNKDRKNPIGMPNS